MTHGDSAEGVRSCTKGLECSPSKNSKSSPIYHGGSKSFGRGGRKVSPKLSPAHHKRGH